MQGSSGDVSDALSGSIPGLSGWLPPGFLEFIHTPGHLLGHTSFLHKPSSSLVAGDVACNIPPPFHFGRRGPRWTDPPSFINMNNTELHVGFMAPSTELS